MVKAPAADKAAKAAPTAKAAPVAKAKPAARSAATTAAGGKRVKVTYVRSANNRPAPQLVALKGLGLRGLNSSRELMDTPSVRGLIKKVAHLLRVEEI